MIAEKRNTFLEQKKQQELVRQEQLQIRKSATQEEYRNFVRGTSKSLSGDVLFTSHSHQLTESIRFLKSFFERCFDTELRNNRSNEVKIYNASIGDYEYVSYHHLAFMKGEELAAIKEIIIDRLTSNWKNLLSYEYADEFNGIRFSVHDFKDEIYGDNGKLNPNVRVIQFDSSLSELFQTFIHKLLAEK